MQQTIHSYFIGKYFSTGVRVFGWIASLVAFLMLLDSSLAALALFPVGFITHFTSERLEFNLSQMTYRRAIHFGGLVFGKSLLLPGFDFLFLKKNNYKRTLESRGSMSEFKMEKYDGYLKLTDGVKLKLLQTDTKEKAIQQMEQISRDLNVELRDLSEMKYY